MTTGHQKRRDAPASTSGFEAWAPRITRMIGWGGVLFVAIFWALTNRIEPMLIGLFGSFATGGEVLAAWRDYRVTGRAPPDVEE